MARTGLATTLAVLAIATTACTLPEAPERVERTNADAARGKPYPTLGDAAPGAQTVEVLAEENPETKYDKEQYEAKAGVVNISFTSPANSNHNLNLVGPGAPYPLLWGPQAGGPVDKLTHAVELQKGTYILYCSVPGHRPAGMESKLVVG